MRARDDAAMTQPEPAPGGRALVGIGRCLVAIDARATATPGDRRRGAAGPRDGAAAAGAGTGPLPGLPPPAGAGPQGRARSGSRPCCRRRRGAPELIYCPANLAPLASRRNVVVIHDVAALRQPEWYGPRVRRATSARSCRCWRAGRGCVITVSEFSRGGDRGRAWTCPRTRVRGGAERRGRALLARRGRRGRRRALGLERPYVLAVGTRIARKNLARPGRRRPARSASAGIELVAVGSGRGYMRAEGGLALRELGYVPDELLPGALRRRRAHSSCPRSTRASGCRASRRWPPARRWWRRIAAALPEVCGGAALLVDPTDEAAVAAALLRAAADRRAGAPALAQRRARARPRLLLGAQRRAHRRELGELLATADPRRREPPVMRSFARARVKVHPRRPQPGAAARALQRVRGGPAAARGARARGRRLGRGPPARHGRAGRQPRGDRALRALRAQRAPPPHPRPLRAPHRRGGARPLVALAAAPGGGARDPLAALARPAARARTWCAPGSCTSGAR